MPFRNVLALLLFVSSAKLMLLMAEDPPGLARAKAMDQEIRKLNDLPAHERTQAINSLIARIKQQPQSYAFSLACNLALSAGEASERQTLIDVAQTLADVLRREPVKATDDSTCFSTLAEFSYYHHLPVSLDDARYTAAIRKFQNDDQYRGTLNFSLRDLQGREWSLHALAGKVVLVNFWATWCPPCRKELPDFNAAYARFQSQGLVVLAITDEEAAPVRQFAAQEHLAYPVLLDPGESVKKLFRVKGIPRSFLYDREGRLAAEFADRPSRAELLEALAQAGLR